MPSDRPSWRAVSVSRRLIAHEAAPRLDGSPGAFRTLRGRVPRSAAGRRGVGAAGRTLFVVRGGHPAAQPRPPRAVPCGPLGWKSAVARRPGRGPLAASGASVAMLRPLWKTSGLPLRLRASCSAPVASLGFGAAPRRPPPLSGSLLRSGSVAVGGLRCLRRPSASRSSPCRRRLRSLPRFRQSPSVHLPAAPSGAPHSLRRSRFLSARGRLRPHPGLSAPGRGRAVPAVASGVTPASFFWRGPSPPSPARWPLRRRLSRIRFVAPGAGTLSLFASLRPGPGAVRRWGRSVPPFGGVVMVRSLRSRPSVPARLASSAWRRRFPGAGPFCFCRGFAPNPSGREARPAPTPARPRLPLVAGRPRRNSVALPCSASSRRPSRSTPLE